MITTRKAKHLEAATMITYSYANTPLAQSERVHYLTSFINGYVGLCVAMYGDVWLCVAV